MTVSDDRKEQIRQFIIWIDALIRSMEVSQKNENPSNVWKYGGYRQFARKYNQILTAVDEKLSLPPVLDVFDLQKMPGINDTLAAQQKEYFEAVHANASMLKAYLEGELGVVEDATMALRDFLQARLRSAIFKKPEQEREVQDAIEQLLIGRGLLKGEDYDREVGRVKMSVKELVPDFIFLKLLLALEVKLINRQARVKDLVDEINADIAAYSKKYTNLFFLVYDTGYIRDELEFRRDLEHNRSAYVIIVKH